MFFKKNNLPFGRWCLLLICLSFSALHQSAQSQIVISVTDQFYNCTNGNLSVSYHISNQDGYGTTNLSTIYAVYAGSNFSGTLTSQVSETDGNYSGPYSAGQIVTIIAYGYNNNSAPEQDYSFYPTISAPDIPTISTTAMPACNGSIPVLTVNEYGGSFFWSNGAVGKSIQVTDPGIYTVHLSNYCGNSAESDPVIVSFGSSPPPPGISSNNGTLLCNGATTVLTTSLSSGGSIQWSTGATGNSISVNSAGTYYAYEVNSCGASANSNTIVITADASPPAPTVSPAGPVVLCNGNTTTLTSSGGDIVNWFVNGSGLGSATTISINTAGSYSAKLSNACGTSATGNVVVVTTNSTPSAPALSVSGGITLCDGAGLVLTTSPSTVSGTIHWSTGAGGNTITANTAGSYYAYESNASCGNGPNSPVVNITTLNKPVVPTVTPSGNPLLCNGASATLSATGGNITWSNGTTGNTLVVSAAGTYYAYDQNYCGNSSNSNPVIVNTVTCPTPTPGSSFYVCPGALKTLDAGAGYDTYAWSNGQTSRTVAVGPGTYSVTVTKNGCTATSAAVTVNYFAVSTPTITASGPITFCSGNSVTLTASSGAAYLWSNGAAGISVIASSAGGYYVTVTDGNGCQATSAATIVAVNPLPTASISGSTSLCQNAGNPTITFNGSGGTAPYTFTYKVNGGSDQTITTISGNGIALTVPTTTPGTYSYSLVSVRESSSTNCASSASGTAVIIVNALPLATIAGSTTVCQNSGAPGITFTGSGGTAPYTFTYKINGGTGQFVATTSGNSVTISVPVTSAGSFTYALVSVREASGNACSNAASGSATVTVNPLPAASIFGTTTVCQNSAAPTITFTGTGAIAPYIFTYRINGGANQTVTTTGGNSVTVSVPTTVAGTYTYSLVSVQESSGGNCSNSASGSSTVVVNLLPSASITGTTTVCQNSPTPPITFTGSGGTAPYTFVYKINGGANQTVATTSGSSITVSAPTGTPGSFVYSLGSVQESSTTLCSRAVNGFVTIVVNPLPSATIAGSTTVCQNGSAPTVTFTGNGATAPYTFTYKINGGTIQSVTTTSGNSVSISVPTGSAGTYTYTLLGVQESSGTSCSNTAGGSATIVVNPLPAASIAGTTTICQNSSAPLVTFTGSGGTAPYTFIYKINGGANQTVTTVSGNSVTVNAPTGIAGSFVYSLVSVQESSATTCSKAAAGSAIIVVNPLPSAIIAGSTTVCQNGSSPSITFTGSGATAPYTFTYNLNGGANQTVSTTSGNSISIPVSTTLAGTYTYTLIGVKESSGQRCFNGANGNATVIVNPLPAATIAGNTTVCQNSSSPLIIFTGSNATAPYTFTYQINGGANQTVTTIVGNSAAVTAATNVPGTFTYSLISVQESSSTGCTNVASGSAIVVINAQPAAAVLLSPKTHLCNGDTGQLTIYNWTEGFTYRWYKNGVLVTSGSGQTMAVTQAGSYTVMATSNVGCDAPALSNAVIITTGSISTPIITGYLKVCEGGRTKLLVLPGDKNKQYELYRWTDTPIGDTVAWDKSFSAYAGQYRVLVEREGCFDSTVVAVTSNDTEYPAGKLTVTAKDISYGGRVTMVAEVVGAAQYQWTLGNSQPVVTPSNTMSQNYYTRADSVVVKVKAISERNCLTDFSACIKIGKPDSLILVDHSWTGNLKDWNLFPVPFQNELKLSVILKRNESLRVDLFTGEGSWVRSWTFKGLKGENLFSLNNIDNLSSGVKYLITAIYNNEKHTDKIYKY